VRQLRKEIHKDRSGRYPLTHSGESGVGKSNIISRYVENKFSIGMNTTIGLEFSEKHVSVNNKIMVLQVWDTAGQ
jgi:GTPase SAR1 family protein